MCAGLSPAWLAGTWVSVSSPTAEGYTVLSVWKRWLAAGFDRLVSSMLQLGHWARRPACFWELLADLMALPPGQGGSCMLVSAEPSASVPLLALLQCVLLVRLWCCGSNSPFA